jgi:hypothetical protein
MRMRTGHRARPGALVGTASASSVLKSFRHGVESSAMQRAVIALALLAAACSTGGGQNAKIVPPEIELVELVGPSEFGYSGRADIQYQMRVGNRSGEPITLRRVEISSVGTGAYVLRRDRFSFNERIEPDGFGTVTFWAKAMTRGTTSGFASTEPVTLRAIVYFETPVGPFQRIIIRELGQFHRNDER